MRAKRGGATLKFVGPIYRDDSNFSEFRSGKFTVLGDHRAWR
jgi:hypothetical protein